MKQVNVKKGFTLIELLVVISIISLLSSIVLTSLNSARSGAKDAAIKSSATELAKLYELNKLQNGFYSGSGSVLVGGWNSTDAQCDADFTGDFAENARSICKVIIANAAETGGGSGKFYTGVQGAFNNTDHFSLMFRLSDGTFICRGSSGAMYEGSYNVDQPGCWRNP